MDWTTDVVLNFIKKYEKHPVLWDNRHRFYKITSKKCDAWEAISRELGIPVVELKKKMVILLATHRKVCQRYAAVLKRENKTVEEFSPVWFAYKAFNFLQKSYQPKSTMTVEKEDEGVVIKEADKLLIEEDDSGIQDNQAIEVHPQEHLETSTLPIKKKKLQIDRKKLIYKHTRNKNSRFSSAHNEVQTNGNKKKDEFDSYGEYIAKTLRKLDKSTCAFVKKEFGEIIFKAEIGVFANHLMVEPSNYCESLSFTPDPIGTDSPSPSSSVLDDQYTHAKQHDFVKQESFP